MNGYFAVLACAPSGDLVGFLLAFIVAQLQHGHYFEIILPGSIVGLIVGYATQRFGATRTAPATR